MPQRTSFIIVVIVLVIIIALSFFAWDSRDGVLFGVPEDDASLDTGEPLNPRDNDTATPTDIFVREPIQIVRSYKNGQHTFSGTLSLPTPCHTFTYDMIVLESFPEQLHLQFTVTPPMPGTACVQVIAETDFEITVPASENARLTAVTVNGRAVTFSLFEESKG